MLKFRQGPAQATEVRPEYEGVYSTNEQGDLIITVPGGLVSWVHDPIVPTAGRVVNGERQPPKSGRPFDVKLTELFPVRADTGQEITVRGTLKLWTSL